MILDCNHSIHRTHLLQAHTHSEVLKKDRLPECCQTCITEDLIQSVKTQVPMSSKHSSSGYSILTRHNSQVTQQPSVERYRPFSFDEDPGEGPSYSQVTGNTESEEERNYGKAMQWASYRKLRARQEDMRDRHVTHATEQRDALLKAQEHDREAYVALLDVRKFELMEAHPKELSKIEEKSMDEELRLYEEQAVEKEEALAALDRLTVQCCQEQKKKKVAEQLRGDLDAQKALVAGLDGRQAHAMRLLRGQWQAEAAEAVRLYRLQVESLSRQRQYGLPGLQEKHLLELRQFDETFVGRRERLASMFGREVQTWRKHEEERGPVPWPIKPVGWPDHY